MRRLGRHARHVLKLAFAVLIVVYVIRSGMLDFERIARADWRWLVAGWAVLLVLPVVSWLRWRTVVLMQGIEIGLCDAFRLTAIGVFFNAFLFGATGGDVAKAYYIATCHGKDNKAAAVATVALDRMLGLGGLIILAGCVLVFGRSAIAANRVMMGAALTLGAVYGTTALAIGGLMIPRFRRTRQRLFESASGSGGFLARAAGALDKVDGSLQELLRHPRQTAFCVALSLAGHVASVVAFHMLSRGLGSEIGLGTLAVLVPLALAVNALPIWPAGGLGAGEAASAAIFEAGAGASLWLGGSMLFLWRLGTYAIAPLGLVFFIVHRDELREVVPDGTDEECALAPAPDSSGA